MFLFRCLCFSLPFTADITKKLNCISKSLNTALEEPTLNWLTKLLIFSQTQVVLLLNKWMDFSLYAIHLPVDVSIHFFNDLALGLYWIYILRIHGYNGGSIKSGPVETHKPVCLRLVLNNCWIKCLLHTAVSLRLSFLTSGRAKVGGRPRPQRQRFRGEKFIGTNKNSSDNTIRSCLAFQAPLLSIVSEKKPRRRKKGQKGEAEHERVEEAEYERARKKAEWRSILHWV